MRLYLRQKYREQINFQDNLRVLTIIIGAGFAVLFLRLAQLQLFAGAEFRLLSERNCIRLLPLKAPRGLVYDCRGNILVDNRPSFTVSLIPAEASDQSAVMDRLAPFLEFDKETALNEIENFKYAPYKQIVLARDVSINQAAAIEEYSLDLPGIVITAEPCRRFPLGSLASHVLGYPGEINAEELGSMPEYRIGDMIGKTGLELVAERWLHGRDGGMQVQVYADAPPQVELDEEGNPHVRIDTAGRKIPTLGITKPPIAGKNVYLSLDLDMQRIAEEEMKTHLAGVAIVMNAQTGAVRALVSKPGFDPNIFVTGGANEQRLDILNDPLHPLLNRALQAYSPGSIFKIVTAYAALSEGVITPETRITCNGSYTLGRRRFRCWKDHGHGSLNIVQAIAYSCDVFFYTIGLDLGIENIERYARMFGLGQNGMSGWPGEMRGIVPSPEWKREAFRTASDKRWYDGETVNTSIGQGYVLVTPLQMARAFAMIVNGGLRVSPYLIETVRSPNDGSTLFQRDPQAVKTLDDDNAIEIVREGVIQAVQSRQPFYGTAWRARNDVVSLAGKTGTAQVAGFVERSESLEDLDKVPYELRDHAWFVEATMSTDEPLVIVVLCEHSGHASETAVPVGREIAKRIATLPRTAPQQPYEESVHL